MKPYLAKRIWIDKLLDKWVFNVRWLRKVQRRVKEQNYKPHIANAHIT
jgi:hypothetical protein